MSQTGTRRHRRNGRPKTPATPVMQPPTALPAPKRGATLNLQDPTSFIKWLSSNADGFEANAKQAREDARAIWAVAAEHDRNGQALHARMEEVRGEIDALAKKLDDLAAQREAERQKKEMRAAEAKQLDDRAQNSENAAADIHASIPVLTQAAANANDQAPPAPASNGTAATATDLKQVDPTEARIDEGIAKIDALRAELPPELQDRGEL